MAIWKILRQRAAIGRMSSSIKSVSRRYFAVSMAGARFADLGCLKSPTIHDTFPELYC